MGFVVCLFFITRLYDNIQQLFFVLAVVVMGCLTDLFRISFNSVTNTIFNFFFLLIPMDLLL